ncbi:MAG: cytochrome c1 [Alphaproteobacteria bacterium]|nr:cytochrome c1 [Alphaproteobacteria bacterium]
MRKLLATAAVALASLSGQAFAEGSDVKLLPVSFSFEGPFGTYDYHAVQRGFQVYKEVCAACHGLSLVAYRNLQQIGLSEAAVKAIAADVQIRDLNDVGEMADRPGRPADRFRSPFPNELAARAANNGAYPPDLSLMIKARPNGAHYVYSLLQGYEDFAKLTADQKKAMGLAADFKMQPNMQFNKFFPGHQIAMPKPLNEGQVTYNEEAQKEGIKNDLPQLAKDVVHFLAWASEPKMEERKKTGVKAVLFLVILAGLFYAVKRKVWADVH